MNEYRFTFTGNILYSTRILIYFSKYTESIEGEMQFKYIFFLSQYGPSRSMCYLMQYFCLFVCFFLTNEINKSVHNNDFNTVNALCVLLCGISENAMVLFFLL